MLLIDGVRYDPYEYKGEKELEDILEEHVKDVFGEDVIYFEKKKISSLSGIGVIPDGFAIALGEPPRWYVVEVELSEHDAYKHVVDQVTRFASAIKNPETQQRLTKHMDDVIRSQPTDERKIKERIKEDVHRFLSDLIRSPPTILIIVDKRTKKLDQAVTDTLRPLIDTKVVELRTIAREGVGITVHAHLFEPLHKPNPPPQSDMPQLKQNQEKPVISVQERKGKVKPDITNQLEYTLPLLESLIEMGGSGRRKEILEKVHNKMKSRLKPADSEKLTSGNIRWMIQLQWHTVTLGKWGFMKKEKDSIWKITDTGQAYYERNKDVPISDVLKELREAKKNRFSFHIEK